MVHFTFQAISILRGQCRVIKDIHLCYCDYDPLAMDVILNMTEDGIRLVFDPISQRLKIIEVCMKNIRISSSH